MGKVKTGECYFRDAEGNLCLAESFVDEAGVVTSEERVVEPAV